MALVRWNPATEMDAFRRQMDRLFDEMTGDRALTPQWGQLLLTVSIIVVSVSLNLGWFQIMWSRFQLIGV